MKPFTFTRAGDLERAVRAGAAPGARFVAGGTTVVDLMRLEVVQPDALVDITGLPLAAIEASATGGLVLGALARNSDVARHPTVAQRYPVLAEALLAGASPQVRNAATVGGNLLQGTRCPYFRDLAMPCNKRAPSTGCSAIGGYTRSHAILGGSDHCVATHPSDMAVALVVLDAIVHTHGPSGSRTIPIGQFHTVPGERPHVESMLVPGELVTRVELPPFPAARRSTYVKARDRAAFAFALASAAVALELRDGKIAHAHIALGGVATKPWRADEAEHVLVGKPPAPATFAAAATAALAGAKPLPHNAFKVELARRVIVRALERATTKEKA